MTGPRMDSHEAALYLRCSLGHVYRLVHQGKLSYYKPTGGRLWFYADELDAFIARGRRRSSAELIAEADAQLDRMGMRV